MGLEFYDTKVLLALLKSIAGRKDFFRWLVQAYPELAAFSNTIRGDEQAMVWLFKHGYAWLAILSLAIDGDPKALHWIEKACSVQNLMFALACREDDKALRWLVSQNKHLLLFMAKEVHAVLDTQATENAGPYVMHFGSNEAVVNEMQRWLAAQKTSGQ